MTNGMSTEKRYSRKETDPPNLPAESVVEGCMLSTRWLSALITASLVAVILSFIIRPVSTANDARRRNAKAQIGYLSDRLQRYAEDHGRLPASLGELAQSSGGDGPYLKGKDLLDPYNHMFMYVVPGAHGAFDLVFLGKDGKAGGIDYDADIGNWELPTTR